MENTKIISTATLEGFTRLSIDRKIITYEGQKLISSSHETINLDLKKINASELRLYKASKKPGVVVKAEPSYYYKDLPQHLQKEDFIAISKAANTLLFTEYCDYCNDSSFTTNCNNRCTNCPISTSSKKKIEYDFITIGFEGFNMSDNFLRILICENHKKNLSLHNAS